MNWGKGIAIAYTTFAVFMVVMVVIMSRQTVDLEADNYYELELKHQSKIDAADNYVNLKSRIDIKDDLNNPVINIPNDILQTIKSGIITFQRKGDKNLDFSFNIDKNTNYQVPNKKLKPGVYKVSMDWSDGQKNYYKEDVVRF